MDTTTKPFEVFDAAMDDGVTILLRHHAKPGATRLFITHGNGFAIDGYRVFWQPLLDDFDVVLFDMRNHGLNETSGADGHHYQQFAKDLGTIHACAVENIGPAKSVGVFHSMSARAAMKNAVELGSPFDALVLFDPPNVPPPDHELYEGMREFELKLVNWAANRRHQFNSRDELVAEFAEARPSSKWLPQAREDMARAQLRRVKDGKYCLSCPGDLEASIYLAALTLDLWPKASELRVPTKLVGADPLGRGAPPTGPANKALAVEGNYDYSGMEHAGHLMQIEKPEDCRNILRDFLKGLHL